MLPSSASASSPSTARHHTISANIYISTLILIAALLSTLMLLWHISTITLVENYMMPEWWVRAFLAEHANGWRVGVWAVVGVLVPVDCVHALMCLDWWCAVLHAWRGVDGEGGEKGGCGGGKTAGESALDDDDNARRQRQDRGDDESARSRNLSYHSAEACEASDTSQRARSHSYHPFLNAKCSPPARFTLLTIFDILMIAALAAHIVTYFISLPTALAFCNIPAVLSHPDIKFGETGRFLSVRDGCMGLNVDMHIAGGFAVFMAIVLGLLHVAALLMRVWEGVRFGRQGMAGQRKDVEKIGGWSSGCGAEASCVTVAADSRTICTLRSTPGRVDGPHKSDMTSIVAPRDVTSISAEECSTGVRLVDWSVRRTDQTARRRAGRTEDSEASKGDAKWSEVLLECLNDG